MWQLHYGGRVGVDVGVRAGCLYFPYCMPGTLAYARRLAEWLRNDAVLNFALGFIAR